MYDIVNNYIVIIINNSNMNWYWLQSINIRLNMYSLSFESILIMHGILKQSNSSSNCICHTLMITKYLYRKIVDNSC